MGTTIFTRQAVEYVDTPNGRGFVLHEETFEKNCHPHTPTWGCVGIGRREDVLRIIFRNASSCEGGMFRPRSGGITPEGYVDRWKKAFANATRIEPHTISVKKPMSSFGSPDLSIPVGDATGCPLTAEQIIAWNAGQECRLDLSQDFDSLGWLANTSRLSAWRIISGSPGRNLQLDNWGSGVMSSGMDLAREVFFSRLEGKPMHVEVPRYIRLFEGDENLYEVMADGSLQHRGWAYSIVGSFVAQYHANEIVDPGWYKNRFRALREATEKAGAMNRNAVLVPFIPDGASEYEAERTEKLIAAHPNGIYLGTVVPEERYAIANAAGYHTSLYRISPHLPDSVAPEVSSGDREFLPLTNW